VRRCGV